MKVVHIITSLGDGGAENTLFKICKYDTFNKHFVISLKGPGKYFLLLNKLGIKVYCLKSLGEKDFGTDYSLKMLNEDIIFYDDTKDKLDDISNTSILNKTVLKRIKFSEVIKSL